MLLSLLLLADLTGSWTLDREASEDMDTLLRETQDLSWVERRLAATVDVTHVITQQGDTLEILIVAPVYERKSTLETDKTWRPSTGRNGPTTQRAWWEGEILVVESRGSVADGTPALYRTERSVADDDMTLLLTITAEDGRSWRVKRVLRRVD